MITATRYRASAEIARQTSLAQQIARAQADISTGKRIDVPSDDPIAAARVAEIRKAQADQTVWTRNIETAKALSAQVDTTLGEVANIMDRAKELLLAGSSQTVSDNDRQAMALELRNLVVNINQFAATSTPTGQPLFPENAPLRVAVSSTLRLPATARRADVFEGVETAAGEKTLAGIVSDAADALGLTDPAARKAAAAISLAELDAGVTHSANQRSTQGVRAARLDTAAESLINTGLLLTEERSSLEDTDVAATVLKLQAKTLSLEAAQAAFARVNRNTLFDLLG